MCNPSRASRAFPASQHETPRRNRGGGERAAPQPSIAGRYPAPVRDRQGPVPGTSFAIPPGFQRPIRSQPRTASRPPAWEKAAFRRLAAPEPRYPPAFCSCGRAHRRPGWNCLARSFRLQPRPLRPAFRSFAASGRPSHSVIGRVSPRPFLPAPSGCGADSQPNCRLALR